MDEDVHKKLRLLLAKLITKNAVAQDNVKSISFSKVVNMTLKKGLS